MRFNYIISAGFDSALGDPLGQVGVTPLGYAYMTQVFRQLCPRTVVLLEGGYDLHALSVSSEAVVQMLRIHTNDSEGVDNYIHQLHCENVEREAIEDSNMIKLNLLFSFIDPMKQINIETLPKHGMEQMRIKSLIHPRESFKQTASKLAKELLKKWPFMEHLIFEKIRRKSSAVKSDYSSDDNQKDYFELNQLFVMNDSLNGLGHLRKIGRSQSHQVEDPIEEEDVNQQ